MSGPSQDPAKTTLSLAAQGRLAAHLRQGLEKSSPSNGQDVLSPASAGYGQLHESAFGSEGLGKESPAPGEREGQKLGKGPRTAANQSRIREADSILSG